MAIAEPVDMAPTRMNRDTAAIPAAISTPPKHRADDGADASDANRPTDSGCAHRRLVETRAKSNGAHLRADAEYTRQEGDGEKHRDRFLGNPDQSDCHGPQPERAADNDRGSSANVRMIPAERMPPMTAPSGKPHNINATSVPRSFAGAYAALAATIGLVTRRYADAT
jgi:hypothetical protein